MAHVAERFSELEDGVSLFPLLGALMALGNGSTISCINGCESAKTERVRPVQRSKGSQSVKTATPAAVEVGYDTAKQVKGRKRHLLVDPFGFVLMVVVTAASVPERAGAKLVLAQLEQVRHWFSRLVLIWVDGGYSGTDLRKWVMDTYRWVFETVLRTDKVKGFVPIPQRWKVE